MKKFSHFMIFNAEDFSCNTEKGIFVKEQREKETCEVNLFFGIV